MIQCKLCNKEMKGLTLHLIKKHSITPKQYQELFPGSKMFSDETLNSPMFGGKNLKGKKIGPFSDEHRRKISKAKSQYTGWSHSPETIQRMKDSWEADRTNRIAITKEAANRPEVKEKQRKAQQERIAKNGYHLKRGKSTKLEKRIQSLLDNNNITYKREHRSFQKLNGVYRYFDFYLPSQNLIIEVDGEFWHQQPGRIEIDLQKEADAKNHGYSFLRLSDVFSKEILSCDETLLSIIIDQSQHEYHTRHVISSREVALSQKAALVTV